MSAGGCPSCGAGQRADSRFCEVCGWSLSPVGDVPAAGERAGATPADSSSAPPRANGVTSPRANGAASPTAKDRYAAPCPSCAGVVSQDGYCETCGAPGVSERDHFEEQPAPWLAGTSDRGVRHRRNEDALALAVLPATDRGGPLSVLVVCDGVSSSTDPDIASLAAAQAAREVLSRSRVQGMDTAEAHASAMAARVGQAVEAAHDAVVAVASAQPAGSPASSTIVVAVVEDHLLVLGSVGDSRAYWLPERRGRGDTYTDTARVLTIDDSVAAELIAAGVPPAAAESGAQAHAITRWLGVDSPDHSARATVIMLDGPGWLVVCTDGLWNYASDAIELGALVARTAADHPQPLELSRALVEWANEQGGHDNITVGVARIGGRDGWDGRDGRDGRDGATRGERHG